MFFLQLYSSGGVFPISDVYKALALCKGVQIASPVKWESLFGVVGL